MAATDWECSYVFIGPSQGKSRDRGGVGSRGDTMLMQHSAAHCVVSLIAVWQPGPGLVATACQVAQKGASRQIAAPRVALKKG